MIASAKKKLPPSRIVITNVQPHVQGGYAVKCCIGDAIPVTADIFVDGNDQLSVNLKIRHQNDAEWSYQSMDLSANDCWHGRLQLEKLGIYYYAIEAWVDTFITWQKALLIRLTASVDVSVDVLIGIELMAKAAKRALAKDRRQLNSYITKLKQLTDYEEVATLVAAPELISLMQRYAPRQSVQYSNELPIDVDRVKANFSSWYELFPRSCSEQPDTHGTFQDVIKRLPYIKELGFDTIYLPPIHPIGITNRKGKNNCIAAEDADPGSPWAIGAQEGGHKSIHPQLGTLNDFKQLIAAAEALGMEIALDFALQCSPDHPYLQSNRQWFKVRPDGTLQYAENPPKKYEDIYPFDFDSNDWQGLWQECKSIIQFWVDVGIKIFRVDNPHTKPFALWQWLISEIKSQHPEVIFLAEAFTRQKIMYHLAKVGFSQSYTYFTWRNTKQELIEYFTELTSPPVCYFFRANVWPNTPDILHEYLQTGGRMAFIVRFILAATLATNYGIYGPVYELCCNTPEKKGSEEYLHSEKYQLKQWDVQQSHSIKPIIARVNEIRKQNTALHNMHSLKFHPIDNPYIIAYSKSDGKNVILVLVNLDPHQSQSGQLLFSVEDAHTFQMEDLLNQVIYDWQGHSHYICLNAHNHNTHIFRVVLK